MIAIEDRPSHGNLLLEPWSRYPSSYGSIRSMLPSRVALAIHVFPVAYERQRYNSRVLGAGTIYCRNDRGRPYR
jgi:hypothetical protein